MQWLGGVFAVAAILGAQGALAQSFNSCPEGQAVQGSDPSGKHIACVAIPDVSGLQSQIDAEKAARQGMDGTLLDAINQLRADAIEGSIVGSYAVSGTQVCLTASRGFNANLQPIIPPPPPPFSPDPLPDGTIPLPPPPVLTFVNATSLKISGVQTFNPGGTGTIEAVFHAVSHPGQLFGALGTAGTGNGTVSSVSGTFSWSITADNKLVIQDTGLQGLVVKGGLANWTITTSGSPNSVSTLGKDLRIITTFQEDMVPEVQTLTPPPGSTQQPIVNQRICARERLLRKM
jgi:hypothetical protein